MENNTTENNNQEKNSRRGGPSWNNWGNPIGAGLWLIAVGVFLVLLRVAGLL